MTSTPVVARPPAARPSKPRPKWGVRALVVLAIIITIVAAIDIDFDLTPLLFDSGRGWFIVSEFLKPDWAFLLRTVDAWLATLAIAVIATVVGSAIALGIAMLSSMVTARNRVVYQVTKALMSVLRSLPDVAWGLLFVAFVGVGTLAGILALIFFNIGIVAKLTAETIDAVELGPLEAADASGASGVQRAFAAVVPQILPNYLSYVLYTFELNVRASVVLGMVGAGGIGSTIMVELARFNYDNLSSIIIMLFVVVLAIDYLSLWVRKRLIG